jgi:hypothetical protein
MTRSYKIMLAMLGMGLSIPAQAANLITNGGFESPGGAGSAVLGAGFNLDGWTVTGDSGNSVFYLKNDYVEPGITFPSHGGDFSVDLTGAGNTSPLDGVFQNVATTIGSRYKLTFWIGNQASFGGASSTFYSTASTAGLWINDVLAGDFTNADETSATVNWQQFTYGFTATSASTKIAFLNNTPVIDNYLGLDDVSLTAVPEPASWAMMIAGFALAGGAMRRANGRRQSMQRLLA